jgi:hypothetical protein
MSQNIDLSSWDTLYIRILSEALYDHVSYLNMCLYCADITLWYFSRTYTGDTCMLKTMLRVYEG